MTPAFGSSGIRGPWSSEVTPDLALRMGRALGAMRGRVVVGRDARTTGPLLTHAAIAGLLSSGADVTDAGVLSTPALALGAGRADAGLVITASHNPACDNGFKLWERDGRAFGAQERAQIERTLALPPALASWDRVGALATDASLIERHIQRILDLVGPVARRLRVVVDCGNGAACAETPQLLRRLGCDVIALNAQPDGHFPGRPSEPNEANLADLRALVVSSGADLGLAHDGDADRCMAVTHTGRFVNGDELLVLFAREHRGATIVCPVDASRIVEDVSGCRVVRTRVGDAHVSEALAAERGAWGGEASGAWIFPEMGYCPDGPLAAAKLCQLVAANGSLESQLAAFPRYPLWRHAWRLPPTRIASALRELTATLSDGKLTTIDGVRAEFQDGWVLIRPSGTEPKLRVTVEATDAAALERLQERVMRAAPASE